MLNKLLKGVILLFLLLTPTVSKAITLEYILPTLDGKLTYSPDDDEWVWACEQSDTLNTDLAYVYLYRYAWKDNNQYPFIEHPGEQKLVRIKEVGGRQGQVDTLQVNEYGIYYITAADSSGNQSCASNGITYAPTTGVPIQSSFIRKTRVYDIHGKLVTKFSYRGIYFVREEWDDGRVVNKRIVYLK